MLALSDIYDGIGIKILCIILKTIPAQLAVKALCMRLHNVAS